MRTLLQICSYSLGTRDIIEKLNQSCCDYVRVLAKEV